MNNRDPLSLREYAAAGQSGLTEMAWSYYAGGADDEVTLRENEAAWGRARLHYRILADVETRSRATRVLGHEISLPVIAAPTAFHRLADDVGEVATARACNVTKTPLVLSSWATSSNEDVGAAAPDSLKVY